MNIELLESRVAPAADLTATIFHLDFNEINVPGEKAGFVTFNINNVASAPADPDDHSNDARGETGFHVYLSLDQTLSNEDPLIGKISGVKLKLAPGESLKRTASVVMPLLHLDGSSPPSGNYYVLAEADSGFRINESNEGNNIGASAETIRYEFQFGNLPEGSKVRSATLTGLDQNQTPFMLKITGDKVASGTVIRGANVDINLTGTTEKTIASGTIAGGVLHDLTADGPIKSIVFPAAFVHGDVNLPGGIQQLFLFCMGGPGSKIAIGGGTAVKSITLGKVNNLDIEVPAGIHLLQVIDWQAPDTDTITAAFIGTLKATGAKKAGVAGDFEGSLMLNGANLRGLALITATVPGTLGGTWTISGANGIIGKIDAAATDQWKLVSGGGVATLDIENDLVGDKNAVAVKAAYFGKIDIGGALSTFLETTGADPKGFFAITKLDVGDGIDGTILASEWVKEAVIAGEMAGTFQAASFEKVTMKGVFKGVLKATDTVVGAREIELEKVAIGHLDFKGDLDHLKAREWNGGSIKADTIELVEIVGGGKEKLAGNFINVTLTTVGAAGITGAGDLGGLEVEGGMGNTNLNLAGNLSVLTADEWLGGSLSAKSLGFLKMEGDTKRNLRGDLSGVTINLTGTGGLVPTVQIDGLMGGLSSFTTNTTVKKFSVGEMENTTITSTTRIEFFEVTGLSGGNPPHFESSNVDADSFGTIFVRQVADYGTEFGFGARSVDNYSRVQNGVTTRLENLTNAGSYDIIGNYRVKIT